jgi:hypothetical protein
MIFRMGSWRVAVATFAALACFGAATLGRSSRIAGRDAWTIGSALVRVSVVQSGGHVAEISLAEPGAVNPLWVQSRPTIDPDRYDAKRDAATYGGGPSARLMSGLIGHNLCFPYWGNPSATEERAGMTFHGEAGVVRWKLVSISPDRLTVDGIFPESKTRMERTIRVAGQIAYFQETASNDSGWDRPVGWCEHVTMGPPFLEKAVTVFDASLTRGRKQGDDAHGDVRWPVGVAESVIDLRKVRNIEKSGFVDNFQVDPSKKYGWFTAVHPGKRVLIGYMFRTKEFPWLNIWEANEPAMLTRGMEFSNTPLHGTMKTLVAQSKMWDTPTFEWLDGHGQLIKRYLAFTTRVPADFGGVEDVRAEGVQLVIVERGNRRRIQLALERLED